MAFKIIDSIKNNQSGILGWCLFIKMLIVGIDYTDCLGALVILSVIQVGLVVKYKFPERPDLFKELSLIQDKINEQIEKSESLERDVTALKFGQINKR